MPSGTVKWFNQTKGFGFIAPDDGGSDVFVHISAVERAGLKGLTDNQKIQYELEEGRDGRLLILLVGADAALGHERLERKGGQLGRRLGRAAACRALGIAGGGGGLLRREDEA